jgi:hypothetical protein
MYEMFGSMHIHTVLVKFMCTNCIAFSNSKYMFFHLTYTKVVLGWVMTITERDNMQVTTLKMSPINSVSQDLRKCMITQVVQNILALIENTCKSSSILMLFSHLWQGTPYKRICWDFTNSTFYYFLRLSSFLLRIRGCYWFNVELHSTRLILNPDQYWAQFDTILSVLQGGF